MEFAESIKLLPSVDVNENGPVYAALLALLIENQLINPLITNCAAAALEDATIRIAGSMSFRQTHAQLAGFFFSSCHAVI